MKIKNIGKVHKAYDEIFEWFDNHRNKTLNMEKFYLNLLQQYIPPGSKILDVGCGTGEPIARFLIDEKYLVTGVDASKKMIELCRQRFPKERWILADMRKLALHEKFDTVIVWHSLFHLSHQDQRTTLKLLASFVNPNGLLIFTTGPEYSEEWVNNGGQNLYQASLAPEEYRQILKNNDFTILANRIRDPECGHATVWVAQLL